LGPETSPAGAPRVVRHPRRAQPPRPSRRRRPSAAPPPLLGAHVSIAGGLHRAIERGAELGCGAMQIFLKNQRQWAASPLTDADALSFRAAWRQSPIRSVFAHASYLINLA